MPADTAAPTTTSTSASSSGAARNAPPSPSHASPPAVPPTPPPPPSGPPAPPPVRAPAPPLEKLAARSHIAPGTPVLPRVGMNRRSPDPISCAAPASADVGQGHPTRTRDLYR